VEITVALDIPDADQHTDPELRQAIFDSYTNYVAVQHMWEVCKWTASLAKFESAGDMQMASTARRIINIHQTWADIAAAAEILKMERRD
jgi:hypothetical protein